MKGIITANMDQSSCPININSPAFSPHHKTFHLIFPRVYFTLDSLSGGRDHSNFKSLSALQLSTESCWQDQKSMQSSPALVQNSVMFSSDSTNGKCKNIFAFLSFINTINSLTPGRFQFNFRKVMFKLTSVSVGWVISFEIALRWMPQDFTDDKSTLAQVLAWCRQATSHYLSQCWPRSLTPYGVTRPQWVNTLIVDILSCQRHEPIFPRTSGAVYSRLYQLPHQKY